ncbi:MFS transporter prlG-like [Lecanosticta acicola]|uniref:MFS transporter prlG-like n=1 Tax=Lecanosticta acicola TaxID=111012 RepID=A0AAI8Z7U7_9PEZI|nr:MFS transporter prlG-like [Lecanosticta acicola]
MAEQHPYSPEDVGKPKVTGTRVHERHISNDSTGLQVREIITNSSQAKKNVLTQKAGYEYTAFKWPSWKKWSVLTVIFILQISMNWNAAIYANAVSGMSKHFDISDAQTRLGQMAFLVAYAFGCELWAPFSEDFGRKWILQGSLFLVNVWQIPCALAPNWGTVLVARTLGGLSSAGGSVTLGIVADMFEPAYQHYALAYVVLASVGGSVVAPIFGGFIEQYLEWQWVFWISLIFGGITQILHLFLVPETRPEKLLAKEAKRRRKNGEDIWAESELEGTFWDRIRGDPKAACKEIAVLMWRPYLFLIKEPIVRWLSLLSGFCDTLIFIGLSSYPLVMHKWNFSTIAVGLSFLPLAISYVIAWATFMPVYRRDRQVMQGDANKISPERRLWWLLFTAPLVPVGLFGYSWCTLGPAKDVHWIAPMIFSGMIGIANFAVYMATIDYMVAAYGPYAASATGGNGFCRDFLAGLAALFANPMYEKMVHGNSDFKYVWPTILLAGIALLLVIPVYFLYFGWGEKCRKESRYAQAVQEKRDEDNDQSETGADDTESEAKP